MAGTGDATLGSYCHGPESRKIPRTAPDPGHFPEQLSRPLSLNTRFQCSPSSGIDQLYVCYESEHLVAKAAVWTFPSWDRFCSAECAQTEGHQTSDTLPCSMLLRTPSTPPPTHSRPGLTSLQHPLPGEHQTHAHTHAHKLEIMIWRPKHARMAVQAPPHQRERTTSACFSPTNAIPPRQVYGEPSYPWRRRSA